MSESERRGAVEPGHESLDAGAIVIGDMMGARAIDRLDGGLCRKLIDCLMHVHHETMNAVALLLPRRGHGVDRMRIERVVGGGSAVKQ